MCKFGCKDLEEVFQVLQDFKMEMAMDGKSFVEYSDLFAPARYAMHTKYSYDRTETYSKVSLPAIRT